MMRWRTAGIICGLAWTALAAVGVGCPALFRLAHPERLWGLLVPAAIVAAWCLWELWKVRAAERLGRAAAMRRLERGTSGRLRAASLALQTLAATLMVVALAQPQWGERPREITRRGIDVVFAVDLSRSMLADDVAPTRLDAAVAELDRLMRRLEGDRVGLVVFAADAVKQSPLTTDYGAIRHYLSRVHPDHFSRQGTSIGRAIRTAHELLVGGESFQRAHNQVIVVISDGEDPVTDPVAAARDAHADGITVYTVGIGTPDGSRIPLRAEDGTIREYVTNRRGEVVVSRLEETQLSDVAEAGGGSYQRYAAEGDVATSLERSFDTYDREALSSTLRTEYQDRFLVFLVPALLLLLIASLLPDGRRRTAATVAALAVLLGSGCDDSLMRPDPVVERAMQTAADGDVEAAIETLDQASDEAQVQAGWSYNRGLLAEWADRPGEAIDAYLDALAAEGSDVETAVLFALGNALLADGDEEAAIERYRRVLRLDPTHEGARRNLELALRILYPPCSTFEDGHEDDDDMNQAVVIPPAMVISEFMPPGIQATPGVEEEPPELVVCGGDPDWIAIPALGGATLDIDVTFDRLREDNGGPPPPERMPPSAVRISLLSYDGVSPIAVDQGLATGDDALADAAHVERALREVELDPQLGRDTMVYLKVDVDAPLEYRWTATVAMTPPCYALEDEFEANDRAWTARRMETGDVVARSCAGNDDWYRVDLAPGDHAFVDVGGIVRDDGSPGSLVVETYAIDDTSVPLTRTEIGPEGGIAVLEQGTTDSADALLYRVYGATEDDEGTYPMSVYHFPPCPSGDDRFEDNDVPSQRTRVPPDAQPPYRHLRICEGDPDWIEVPLGPMPEPEDGEPEPTERPFSVFVDFPELERDTRAEVYHGGTGARVLQTSPVVRPDPEDPEGPGLGGAAGAVVLPVDTPSVIVHVYGDPGFYDLRFPDTQQQQQQQQQQQDGEQQEQDADPQDGEQQDGEQQDGEQQDADPQDGEQQEQDADPQDGDQQDDGEGQDEPRELTPEEMRELLEALQEAASEDEDPEEGDAPAGAEPTDEELSRERLRMLLDSLEDDEINLQIRQATDDLPAWEHEQTW